MRTAINVHGVTSVELTPVYRSLRNGGAPFRYVTITCADGSVLSITAHLDRAQEPEMIDGNVWKRVVPEATP
jgi:hypothetical protein